MGSIWVGTTAPAAAKEGDIWVSGSVAEVIPQLWAASIRSDLAPEWLKARRAELAWLRASLEADCLPDWCIKMVMENW